MESLTDIGVNLNSKRYNSNREDILKSAFKDKVKNIISISNSAKDFNYNITYCKKYINNKDSCNIYCTIGVHPHNTKELNDNKFKGIKTIINKNKNIVVAIGECGLDYNRMFSPQDVQKKWFEEQVKLSIELKMPLYLHERDAHDDFLEILSKYKGQIKGVVHCFTGSLQEAEIY